MRLDKSPNKDDLAETQHWNAQSQVNLFMDLQNRDTLKKYQVPKIVEVSIKNKKIKDKKALSYTLDH